MMRMRIPQARTWRRIHGSMTFFWLALILPTVLVWHDSVLWVGLMSCYANAVGHFSAYQGSRAEDNTPRPDKTL